MAMVYKHSYFVKYMKDGNVKRFNYYVAKGLLLKEGYKLVGYTPNWRVTGTAYVDFSDGVCSISIRTDLHFNERTKKWSCGKVLEVHEWTSEE